MHIEGVSEQSPAVESIDEEPIATLHRSLNSRKRTSKSNIQQKSHKGKRPQPSAEEDSEDVQQIRIRVTAFQARLSSLAGRRKQKKRKAIAVVAIPAEVAVKESRRSDRKQKYISTKQRSRPVRAHSS